MKAFYFWAAVAPLVTLIFLFKMSGGSGSSGYALPFIALWLLIAVVVVSIISGIVTKTFKKSFLGMLVGLPLSFVVYNIFEGFENYTINQQTTEQNTELRNFLKEAQTAESDQMKDAFKKLKTVSVPLAMCAVSQDKDGVYANLLKDENATTDLKDYVFSLESVFGIGEAALQTEISLNEKEAVLYQILKGMISRDSLTSFSKWSRMWDAVHASNKSRTIEFTNTYYDKSSYCAWGSTQSLVSDIIEKWGDEGLLQWLESNHVFATEQQRLVLEKINSVDALEEVIASGTHINAVFKGEEAAKTGLTSVLANRAYSFTKMINEAKDPLDVARLVAAFIRLGADTKTPGSNGKTPCQIFNESENYLDKSKGENKSTPEKKQKAFKFIQKNLCRS